MSTITIASAWLIPPGIKYGTDAGAADAALQIDRGLFAHTSQINNEEKMAIRNDQRINKSLTLKVNTRAGIRRFLLLTWLKETREKKYRYFVETLVTGKHVYLERPGRLNKGCDFVIYIEDMAGCQWKNGNDRPPSHKFLLDDLLRKKRRLSLKVWRDLIASIEAEHQMIPHTCPITSKRKIDALAKSRRTSATPQPMCLQQIVLLCKWLFIEQDLTYWNGEGRDKLMGVIRKL
ncbi:MAG: hypothetical protein MPK11_00610 [Gammaproteobacteria bacterium]|nr:hypothetical protein [Gammaproteobacteria bacterium]CAJ2376665.1 MAG: conserved hypothetical protein [Arenicellales bacterium IbO2]MDA7961731.1 hypothetical protein [Gammaproteobacteria bacterium]MDA7969271.1 hypothetical protein [Gammaproteobacteria bacterium]MDA7971837.1 hypothetical protein [Gammaproteobacteria bacterium]